MFKQKLSRKFKFMTDYLRFQEFTKLQLYISENFILKIYAHWENHQLPGLYKQYYLFYVYNKAYVQISVTTSMGS